MTPTLEAGTKTGAPRPDGRPHELTLHPDGFRLDGRPFQIRSGEMHPVRIPRREWSHRIAMAKAMGLNTISIYLMWNTLEQKPGVFDLHTDRRDFAEFIRLCQRAGMWVFLRPGPYICGEWDFGGLPAYLLFDDMIALRSRDPRYLSACERYIATVAPSLVPLLSQNGGPVLLTQVENEYASFGGDLEYMQWVRDAWQRHGMIGPFSSADGLAQLREKRTFLSDCAIGLDGDLSTAGARTLYPATPAWISEAYPGWLSHWGEKNMAKVEFTEDFRKILDARLSFNLYVVHGGTNFGFGSGANAHGDGTHFQPVVTSYDYDAPIDEAGRATPKFHILRTLLSQTADETAPTIPRAPVMIDFAPVVAECIGGMEDLLPPAVLIDEPISLERGLRQSCGMALYRTTLPAGTGGVLGLPPVHDYARVFLDNFEIGTLSRLEPQSPQIEIQPAARARRLDIWIDSFGHIGFGHALGDRKGLEGPVMIDRRPLRGWQFFGLPLDEHFIAQCARQPASDSPYKFLFRGHVELHKQGGTYINLSAWKKGYCWINGNLLGRYWNLGPQSRLYCPAEWLRNGRNEILILDYHQTESAPVSGHFTMEH